MKTINSGFTLLEVIIVMSILIAMIGGTMYVLFSGQEAFDEGSMTSFLESQATRLVDAMKDDISECLVITASAPTTANNYASLTIKVPVLITGTYWSSDGKVYWGANGNQGWHITYKFEPTGSLNENTDQLDYNRDGDITDSFDIGEMVKYVYSADSEIAANLQETVKLCNDIITVAGTEYADINNDGNPDQIFTLCDKEGQAVTSNGVGVILNFWLGGKLGAKRNPIIVNTNTAIMLINPQ